MPPRPLPARPRPRAAAATVALVALASACAREPPPPAPAVDPPSVVASAAADGGPPAAQQRWELVDQVHRCELRHRGLSIDLGMPGAEWRRGFSIGPFDDLVSVERSGSRVAQVKARGVDLDFWLDQPVEGLEVALRAQGRAARSMSVRVGDRVLGSVRLSPDEFKVHGVSGQVPALAPGRHTLSLRFSGRGKAGGVLAELDWIRLSVRDDIPTRYAAPTVEDAVRETALDGVPRRTFALRAPGSVRCALLVPPRASVTTHIGFWGNGRGLAEVRLWLDGSEPITLHQRKVIGGAGAAWTPAEFDLSPWAGQIVDVELRALETTAEGRVLFGDPAVVRTARPEAFPARPRVVVLLVAAAVDRRRLPPWGPVGSLGALAALGRAGAHFPQYRAPSTVSGAVMASLLTGLHPQSHGVEDPGARLPPGATTLAVLAKEAGARVAFFTGVPTSFAPFGTARGWDRFEAISPVADLPAAEPLRRASAWLSEELGSGEARSRLVVVHLRGGHPPWDVARDAAARLPPEDYAGALDARRGGVTLAKLRARRKAAQRRLEESDWTRLHALADASLAEQDRALAELVAVLQRHGAWDDALVAFTGDSALAEAPALPFEPITALREDLLALPLLVKFPGGRGAGQGIDAPVRTMDVTATLLAALGAPPPARFAGQSLLQVLADAPWLDVAPRVAALGTTYSTRLGPWLISGQLGSAPRFCDLETDPACTRSVAEAHPIAARLLWVSTYEALTAYGGPALRTAPREPAVLDPDTVAALTVWGDL